MDESLARLVALRQGVNIIVDGSVVRRGEGYRISIRAVDAATGKQIAEREGSASNKEDVLTQVGKLAAGIRKGLGDTTPEATQLQTAESFTTSSLEAVHAHAAGLEALAAGKREDAISHFARAVELDPKFARGYIGLAVAYTNLKKQAEAGENYKKALALLDRLSEREKYRTLGIYYLSYVRNYQEAIEALRKLVQLYPADAAGYNNLSLAYAFAGNIPEALMASRRALEITPGDLQRRDSFAGLSMVAGAFETAVKEAQRILSTNPGFASAYLVTALCQLAQGDADGARATYARLEKTNPQGYSMARAGVADLEIYLGAYRPALAALQDGIAADEREHNNGEMAVKYVIRGEALLATGQRAQAVEAADKGAQLSGLEYVLFLAGYILGQAGEEAKANQVAARLEGLLQPQTKAYARLIQGTAALERNRVNPALDAFREAQRLQDSWMSHFLLGRAYVQGGHFAEALSELEICQKRRAEVTDLFLSNTPTLRELPPLYYWLGRAQEGMGTKEAARGSYQQFLKLRSQADPADQMIADAKRRMRG
jgi:tetratricopeptide (TPR) repeat protein